jgi:hypothetical protein
MLADDFKRLCKNESPAHSAVSLLSHQQAKFDGALFLTKRIVTDDWRITSTFGDRRMVDDFQRSALAETGMRL